MATELSFACRKALCISSSRFVCRKRRLSRCCERVAEGWRYFHIARAAPATRYIAGVALAIMSARPAGYRTFLRPLPGECNDGSWRLECIFSVQQECFRNGVQQVN